jgi:predicted transcriptional regulator
MSEPISVKKVAQKLIDAMPDDVTWEDVMYRLYVHRSIEAGLRDVEAGRVVSDADARNRLGLPS